MKSTRILRFCRTSGYVLLFVAGLAACDADLQNAPESMSVATRQATEVMPSDVLFIGRVDLDGLKDNTHTVPFGDAGLFTRHLDEEAMARFDDFVSATGLDPESDLTEVYVALEPDGDEKARGYFAAYGDFDREALQAYIDSRLGDALNEESHDGVPVYVAVNDHHQMAFALASETIIVAASGFDAVAAMLDRLRGSGSSASDNAALMERVARAASAGDLWGVAVKPASGHAPEAIDDTDALLGQLWLAVAAAGGGMDVQADELEVRVQLYPADGVSTDDLADLVEGGVALARSQYSLDDSMRAMLEEADVEVEEGYVSVNTSISNTLLEELAAH